MSYAFAGLKVRLTAFALDYIVIAAWLALIVALGSVVNAVSPLAQRMFAHPLSGQTTGFLLVTLPVSLYFAVFESSAWQATWGKRMKNLRVIRTDGSKLSRSRAISRTALKFTPWELAHTCIWQINSATVSSAIVIAGFALVWVLVGANVIGLLTSRTHQTLYDRIARTFVVTG